MAKKLTPTLARILAESVRTKLVEHSKGMSDTQKTKVKSSKEYKEYEKLRRQNIEIEERMKTLREETQQKYSTPLMKVQVGWNSNPDSDSSVTIYEAKSVSVEAIRDAILLEDYFADSSISHEELVDKIVKKFL